MQARPRRDKCYCPRQLSWSITYHQWLLRLVITSRFSSARKVSLVRPFTIWPRFSISMDSKTNLQILFQQIRSKEFSWKLENRHDFDIMALTYNWSRSTTSWNLLSGYVYGRLALTVTSGYIIATWITELSCSSSAAALATYYVDELGSLPASSN